MNFPAFLFSEAMGKVRQLLRLALPPLVRHWALLLRTFAVNNRSIRDSFKQKTRLLAARIGFSQGTP
jgi:hypothetical protein